MRETVVNNVKDALQIIDQEILKSLQSNQWPSFCKFLNVPNSNIKVDNDFKGKDEWEKYCCNRAIFPIELSYNELNQQEAMVNIIKKKLQNSNITPLKNQEGITLKIEDIKNIKWIEFLKHIESNQYMINFLGFTNGKDSYQVYLSFYY